MKTSRPTESERKVSDFDFNLDEITEEAKKDPVTHAAMIENKFRRDFAECVRRICEEDGVDIEALAASLDIKGAQLRRVLHDELGGNLYMSTAFRLMVALNVPCVTFLSGMDEDE